MYQEKTFNLESVQVLSQEQIQVHLGLYTGYVKNTNNLLEQIETLKNNVDNQIIVSELQRRLGFEFNGMRLHELYFEQISDGKKEINQNSKLIKLINEQFGSVEEYLKDIRRVSSMRGIGWVVTYFDQNKLINAWVSDHELGQLATQPIFALDMWEHAFMVDFRPATKADYVTAYISNLNWEKIEQRLI